MSNEMIEVGAPIPRIASADIVGRRKLRVAWRNGGTKMVDLAPILANRKLYRPLRDDDALFRTMRVNEDGNALEWDYDIEIPAIVIERLPPIGMDNSEFRRLMEIGGYTLDGMAAELGISRRLIAEYRRSKPIPNHIAYATRYLNERKFP